MWFFDFIPQSLFYLLLVLSLIGYLVSLFIPTKILKNKVKLVSIIAIVVSVYLLGMLKVNNHWKAKAAKLQQQVVELEARSQQTNTEIATKLVAKTEVITLRGRETTKYIDREVVKYNNQCEIPREFVEVHNRAAEPVK